MQATTVLSGGRSSPLTEGRSPRVLMLSLAVLLAAQLGLALLLSLDQGRFETSPEGPLLEFDPARVERLRIERSGAEALIIERAEAGWILPAHAGFPAAEAKVAALLERLADLRRRLPVATSNEALTRFKVADADFEGRLVLSAGDQSLGTLYLGDSAGYRRQYVRAAGDSAVFEVALGPGDAPADPDDWIDRDWLRLDGQDIAGIAFPDFELEREDGAWRLAKTAADEALEQDEAKRLVRQLANLSFAGVLGTEAKPEYGLDEPLLEWRIELASGEARSYQLSPLAEPGTERDTDGKGAAPTGTTAEGESSSPDAPDWYVLKVADEPYFLKVAAITAKPLTQISREDLLAAPATPEAEAEAEAAAETASPAAGG